MRQIVLLVFMLFLVAIGFAADSTGTTDGESTSWIVRNWSIIWKVAGIVLGLLGLGGLKAKFSAFSREMKDLFSAIGDAFGAAAGLEDGTTDIQIVIQKIRAIVYEFKDIIQLFASDKTTDTVKAVLKTTSLRRATTAQPVKKKWRYGSGMACLLLIGVISTNMFGDAYGCRAELGASVEPEYTVSISGFSLSANGNGNTFGLTASEFDDNWSVGGYHEIIHDVYLGNDFGINAANRSGISYMFSESVFLTGGLRLGIYYKRFEIFASYWYLSNLSKEYNNAYFGVSYQIPLLL